MIGTLYIVPVPIGNLEDISIRAKRILSEVDLIACEDTRNSGHLLKLLEINYKKLISYHNFNEVEKAESLMNELNNGKSIALISDAGTPTISDPGYRLVALARKNNYKVVPIAGASASIMALSASGYPTDKFTFLGFPPHKKGRKTFLDNLKNYKHTCIIYESPHRIIKFISELLEVFGADLELAVCRELSKLHEEIISGNIKEVQQYFEDKSSIKGEFTIILNLKEK